ncbi:MAG TPA: capsid cement protein [Longimicrobiales bacterium]
MPYEGLGARHTVEAATKACRHGQIVVEDGFVGSAFKVDQVDRFVRPVDAQDIAIGEEFEIQLGGIHEAPAEGALAALGVGDPVFITEADNTLVAAGGAGILPVGIVTEVDASRDPDVLRINSNVWQPFERGEV